MSRRINKFNRLGGTSVHKNFINLERTVPVPVLTGRPIKRLLVKHDLNNFKPFENGYSIFKWFKKVIIKITAVFGG